MRATIQSISDSVPALLAYVGSDRRYVIANRAYKEWLGLDPEAIVGRTVEEVLDAADMQGIAPYIDRALAGEAVTFETRMRYGPGTRDVEAKYVPDIRSDGTVHGFVALVTDVTERKKLEDNERLLSEASRVLASSLEVSTILPTVASMLATWFQGYCIIDLLEGGGLQRAAAVHMDPTHQPLLDEMFAYAPRDDRRSPLWRVIETRKPELCNDVTEETITSTSTSEQHARARRALGTTGYMLAPMIAGGSVAGTIMIGSVAGQPFDQAHLRTVQELAYRLAIAVGNSRAYREAREANRVKDEFLAVVSHELRTPLNAMRGWMALLRGSKLDDAQRARALEIIDRNITAQTQLVDDLLDVSRIVTGGMRLSAEPVDLALVVPAALESIAPAAAARRIELETELEQKVGLVRGDAARLQQVVWNLLSNAIKFTPPGGRVSIRMAVSDTQVQLTVTDTGQGIAPEFLPYVFERFRQGDSTTTRPVGGLGIGLAIVRHLAELHGGTVTAASEGEGQGATFVLSLPLLTKL